MIRSRITGVAVGALAPLLVLTACGSGSGSGSGAAGATRAPAAVGTPSPVVTPVAPSPSAAPATSTATAPTAAPAAVRSASANQVRQIIGASPSGGVSVAALNTVTGATYSAGAAGGMWTASDYKLFVLETLLYQSQGSGGLSSAEQSEAVPMIENSDNTAGYELWEAAGQNAGLTGYASVLRLTQTVAGGTDPAFTTMSGTDGVKLLQALVGSTSPLNAASRSYALGLMREVESDQQWGVAEAADPGTIFENKNGWLSVDDTNGPGENDNGLWIVNSLGVITVRGQQVLMAVFTQHDQSFASGQALVAQLARLAAAAVSPG